LTISTNKPVKFPLYLRIPGWGSAKIVYGDKVITGTAGSTSKIENKWQNGDKIIINIPLNLRYETRYNNAISILRGPLYFALRIEKEYKQVKINYDNFSYKGSVDWEIYPKSAWNFGLVVNKDSLMMGNQLIENQIGKYPFADKGDMIWSSDSLKYVIYETDPPVMIKLRGVRVNDWTMINNSAGDPPSSPVKPIGEPETVTLVPYGCARLRITEFPVMDIAFMMQIAKPVK
jgi:uncharacterized protein